MARVFVTIQDLPKVMPALDLAEEPLPLWWTTDFINASPPGKWSVSEVRRAIAHTYAEYCWIYTCRRGWLDVCQRFEIYRTACRVVFWRCETIWCFQNNLDYWCFIWCFPILQEAFLNTSRELSMTRMPSVAVNSWVPGTKAEDEKWIVGEFNCSCVGISRCLAAYCKDDTPNASWDDISAEDKAEAGLSLEFIQLGRNVQQTNSVIELLSLESETFEDWIDVQKGFFMCKEMRPLEGHLVVHAGLCFETATKTFRLPFCLP